MPRWRTRWSVADRRTADIEVGWVAPSLGQRENLDDIEGAAAAYGVFRNVPAGGWAVRGGT